MERYLTELLGLNCAAYSILPTHCNGEHPGLLDHVFINFGFSNNNNNRIKSLTVTTDITDHYANIIVIAAKKQRLNYANRPYIRIYSSNNINEFQRSMSIIDWSMIFNSSSLDNALTLFTETLADTFNKSLPLIKCSIKKLKDKSWLTKDLKKHITTKNNFVSKI